MSKLLEDNVKLLQLLYKCKSPSVKKYILEKDNELIDCLCDCAHNILQGNIPLSLTEESKLRKHKQKLRDLVTKISKKKKKKILQTGGFLPALLAPVVASVIPSLLGKILR